LALLLGPELLLVLRTALLLMSELALLPGPELLLLQRMALLLVSEMVLLLVPLLLLLRTKNSRCFSGCSGRGGKKLQL
jgi:hypothetical protein